VREGILSKIKKRPKMDKDEKDIEKYKITLELLKYEGEMLWQILTVYMLVNTIIIGFVSQIKVDNVTIFTFKPILFFAGVFGLLLTLPWLGTFIRNSEYYHFRMAQAKQAEPKDWRLLRDQGQKFAQGDQITINNEKFQIICLGKIMRNKRAIYFVICLFALVYFGLIIFFGPWKLILSI